MTGIYMVSAQKPTSVTHSILGRITSPNDLNLVICKSTLLEIYKVTKEGLKFCKQIGLWGVVENLNVLKVKNEKKEQLLITTCKFDLMVLSCEMNADGSYDVMTRTHGNFRDMVPRNSSVHMMTIVDSSKATPIIAIKCYDGILKTIPISSDHKQLNVSTLRMEDLNVVDIAFLHGFDNPTVGLICKEPNMKLNFKVYEIDMPNNKDLTNLLWKKEINDNQAFIIPLPEPCFGVLTVGTQAICYFNNKNTETLHRSPSFLAQGEVTNFAMIDKDGHRYLLSNTAGQLHLMILEYEETMSYTRLIDIHFEYLGDTAIADNMTYIDNGVIFIGSKLGDSQLIKLINAMNENGTFIDVLETYTNLGPILDMLIVDIEKQGQGQLITCSGAHRNGSLRIIRSGIGIHESANFELVGIKALWPLRIFSKKFDDHLVLSFFGYTKIFALSDEEFEDVEFAGFELSAQTLYAGACIFGQFVQVTSAGVRLIKPGEKTRICRLVAEWKIAAGELISVATCNACECLIAFRNQLSYIRIDNEQLTLVGCIKLEHEIACIDMHSFSGGNCSVAKEEEWLDADLASAPVASDLCAIGLWGDISARLLLLPSLVECCMEELKGDFIPRSILIETLESIPYLFVSLGDGSVISYVISRMTTVNASHSYELRDRRKVVLGTQPTILRKFSSSRPVLANNIFACSDRPSVISSNNQKLVYSSVNLKQVEYMCPLNARAYPHSLALLSAGTVRIGLMDSIQKLHIRAVPLNETVRRIAHQADTQSFGVITLRMDMMQPNGELRPLMPSASTQCANQQLSKASSGLHATSAAVNAAADAAAIASTSSKATASGNNDPFGESGSISSGLSGSVVNSQLNTHVINSLLVLNQNTFEVLHAVQFALSEFAISITSMAFESEPSTAYYVVGCCQVVEDDPEPKIGRLVVFRLAENKLLQVCDHEIKGAPYCLENFNGKLLVSVSNSLKLYELRDNELVQLASYSDNIFIIHLKCKNDFIFIGDLMKSCAVLTYRADANAFELVARDHSPAWLSSIEMIDDDHFLMNDCFQNVITFRKNSGQSNEEKRKCLEDIGCIHLGEQINIFRHGSLGMQQQSNEFLAAHFQGNILAGTVSGSIILFASLSTVMFKILDELQSRLGKFVVTAGKIPYDEWRQFNSQKRFQQSNNFIDGDLIESFLELTTQDASNLVKDFKIEGSNIGHSGEEFSVNYFNKLVEELTRMH